MEDTAPEARARHPGYLIIERQGGQSPPKELFAELMSNIGVDTSEGRQQQVGTRTIHKCNGGEAAARLLHHGVDFSNPEWDPFFRLILGCSFHDAIKENPEVGIWAENGNTQRRPIGPKSSVHIFCPATDKALDDRRGLFRIVDGSHIMLTGDIERVKATYICLQPYEILIMCSELTIEYPQTGGGACVWMRVWRKFT
ncbi:hypothetical protein FQN54_009331 [Arachnomyces sp. PD_36]|nr:hypothetical protein FQN54_009331 [Arachnomyces sp. PD_36]